MVMYMMRYTVIRFLFRKNRGDAHYARENEKRKLQPLVLSLKNIGRKMVTQSFLMIHTGNETVT